MANQLANDIEYLIEALTKAYPGKWVVTGPQWQDIIAKLSKISASKDLSVSGIAQAIADILWDIPDGHLIVRDQGQVAGRRIQAHSRIPSTGSNLANISNNKYWSLQFSNESRKNIAVLAISGFPQHSEPVWQGFDECTQKILSADHLIVDLRGNRGGDDAKAIELVSSLLGYELELDWIKEVFCETAEAYALQTNTMRRIIWKNYGVHGLTPPQALKERIDYYAKQAHELAVNPVANEKKKVIEERLIHPRAKFNKRHAFEGKIFLLIDSKTVSSGEWTCLYFKKHPNTVLVGENTYGMIHFGNGGLLILPESRIEITLCHKINELTDGSFFEKEGIPPDIEVRDQDSLDFVLSKLLS